MISGMAGLSALYYLSFHETTNKQTVVFSQEDLVEEYFKNFKSLAESENWEEIISQGTRALEAAKKSGRREDEAKICAQLTSTSFYQGDYSQALIYANRCHELSEAFEDSSLFVRALYLESAIYRAQAGKATEEIAQQALYLQAVEAAEAAATIYSKKEIDNLLLKGKIYFNLGAAHADNPKGDLEKAEKCYHIAIECLTNIAEPQGLLRANIRLGKVYLLQEKYIASQEIIDKVRAQGSNERIAMHIDYLEAQLKLACDDLDSAMSIARQGLARAEALGAKEDQFRLMSLIQVIEKKNSC